MFFNFSFKDSRGNLSRLSQPFKEGLPVFLLAFPPLQQLRCLSLFPVYVEVVVTVLPRSITSAPVSLLKIRASSSFGGTAGVCEHVFEWVSIRSNHQQYSACKGKIKNMEPESYGTIPIKDI